ncbi:CDP-glycerol glycerophosphotransferase family protein [Microlunatus antarcticus]|uniref:CDP-glycerol glycerophosphotransferase n=1 Tax=Microlunatus antarcticus TaxID=53388 RepID=A0A7W5JV26_9ACTN|nr:CDP-glycerol glycerophosphotransferase family protein [Microlunatus antarcticus]MBB3326778.1 CDP-glycerol glycerophosphotransferase [Microlunatus antarcticus]
MRTRTHVPDAAEPRPTIVYDSFAGRYSDSPRALHTWLTPRVDADHVWLVDPAHRAGFPSGVATVPYGSAESVAALEAADLVVGNTHIEISWTKRPGSTYLQLWHGTPLKTVHRDVRWAPPGRLDWLEEDVARWDHLLSPSPASTPRLRSAFRWGGSVLELGYPRNDVLQRPVVDEVRARTRASLGLADDETVVLYAPTFRDRMFDDRSTPLHLALDLERLVADLGPGVRVLTRVHYFMTDRLVRVEVPGVLDVSWHPDIAELYAAADVLVTDYSSSMFDFAVTGKPLIFYTYDLETYRDVDRGFYFELEPVAPGPVVRTQEALTAALTDLPGVRRAYATAYREFRRTYCALDDGHATRRVGRFVKGQLLAQRDEALAGL